MKELSKTTNGETDRLIVVRPRKRTKKPVRVAIMAPALVSVAAPGLLPLARGPDGVSGYKIVRGRRGWTGNFSEVLFTPQVWGFVQNQHSVHAFCRWGWASSRPSCCPDAAQIPRGKILFRTLSTSRGYNRLVIMFLWKFFYNPSPAGVLNRLLTGINDNILSPLNALAGSVHLPMQIPMIEAQTWLQDPRLAMLCIVIPIVWASVGPGCIIYLAALKSVPEDVYEAADLDGAGVLHKITHITIPYLRPLIIINFVGAFIAAFRSFDFIFAMTG